MLIECPECNKEISDKSKACIYCGYPLQKSNLCKVNGKECDLTFLLDESYSILYKVRDLIQISGSDIIHVKPEVEKIMQNKEIPDFLNLPLTQSKESQEQNSVHCPKCGSTNIQMVPRKWSILTGFMTNKVDRVCVNCKNKF